MQDINIRVAAGKRCIVAGIAAALTALLLVGCGQAEWTDDQKMADPVGWVIVQAEQLGNERVLSYFDDGVLTRAEYEAESAIFATCLTEAGFSVGEAYWDPVNHLYYEYTEINWVGAEISFEARDELYFECEKPRSIIWGALRDEPYMAPELVQRTVACLEEEGVTLDLPAAGAVNYQELSALAGTSETARASEGDPVLDCVLESSRQLFPEDYKLIFW